MKRVLLAVAVSTALLLPASSAFSHDLGYCIGGPTCPDDGYAWNQYHAVGYISSPGDCGETSSRYVKHVKAILYASGWISAQSGIDQTFNSSTRSHMVSWQQSHNLTADGCAGFNTLAEMQNGRHYNSQLGIYYYHIEANGNGSNGKYYKWRENNGNRFVRYFKYCAGCGGVYGAEHGCWHLIKVVNESNAQETLFNHRIDHDSDANCD